MTYRGVQGFEVGLTRWISKELLRVLSNWRDGDGSVKGEEFCDRSKTDGFRRVRHSGTSREIRKKVNRR